MKVLVVGAGISGCVVARELAEAGHVVTIIDERDHVGGNCHDYFDEYGTRVHEYGPHIFHTDSDEAFDWLSRFTTFVDYKHKVKAVLDDGTYVTLPVNRETAEIVGKENVIDTFFRPYTEKMWGMPLEKVAKSILDRVPIRDDDNEFYFPDDNHQGMPIDGYTDMFMNIINHSNIRHVYINCPYEGKMKQEYDHVFWSGSIDEYYGCSHGMLGYRSLKFHHVTLPHPGLILPVPTVNFTHTGPYTRMTEWKGYPNHGINPHYTSLMYEEPCDFEPGHTERFYPTKNDGNSEALLKMYQAIDSPYVTFIGRCGLYKYMDMDDAVLAALDTARDFINDHCPRN